ncbi:MAG: hypothetical protein ABMA64_29590 [Myxococcota bacterium]
MSIPLPWLEWPHVVVRTRLVRDVLPIVLVALATVGAMSLGMTALGSWFGGLSWMETTSTGLGAALTRCSRSRAASTRGASDRPGVGRPGSGRRTPSPNALAIR